jgi:hypothetical protein
MLNLCLRLCFDFDYYFEIVAAVAVIVVAVFAAVGDDYEKRMNRVLMRIRMRCVVREYRLHSNGDYCLLFVVSIDLAGAFVFNESFIFDENKICFGFEIKKPFFCS